ncbi:hypothetical protein BD413DRAFT_504792 [Trametes elegans]|nr:hypothetical protein BD413DRAFT_504792 [Trametes elegans]
MRAMLVLVDNRTMSSVYVPVSRLLDRRAVLGARDRAVFEDVVTLTIAAANAGLVVHPSSGRDRTQPEVGTLVLRGKRRWVWEAREGWDWNDIESGATPPLVLKSGLRPRAIWRRFHAL